MNAEIRQRRPAPPKLEGERLKFPCGHVVARRRVEARLRTRGNAAWVACPRCRVITLVVSRDAASEEGA